MRTHYSPPPFFRRATTSRCTCDLHRNRKRFEPVALKTAIVVIPEMASLFDYFLITSIALLALSEPLDSSPPPDDLFGETRRFKDVPKALNYVHELLPEQTPLEEKCKRYAVLLAMAAATGLPYETNVDDLVKMDIPTLDVHYHAIDENGLMTLFMSATERYRITRLAPPFIDVIECLKMIDSPVVRKFLDDRELKVVHDLYKRVLRPEDQTDNPEGIEWGEFHPAFLKNFISLFGGLLDIEHLYKTSQVRPLDHGVSGQSSGAPEPTNWQDPTQDNGQETDDMTEPHRGPNLDRKRERARLFSRRVRMLAPEKIREMSRKYKRDYRERKRQREGRVRPNLTPEEKKSMRAERRRMQRRKRRLEENEQKQRAKFQRMLDRLHADEPESPSGREAQRMQLSQILAGMHQEGRNPLKLPQPWEVLLPPNAPPPSVPTAPRPPAAPVAPVAPEAPVAPVASLGPAVMSRLPPLQIPPMPAMPPFPETMLSPHLTPSPLSLNSPFGSGANQRAVVDPNVAHTMTVPDLSANPYVQAFSPNVFAAQSRVFPPMQPFGQAEQRQAHSGPTDSASQADDVDQVAQWLASSSDENVS